MFSKLLAGFKLIFCAHLGLLFYAYALILKKNTHNQGINPVHFQSWSDYLRIICQCLEGKWDNYDADGQEMIQTHAEASPIMCVR